MKRLDKVVSYIDENKNVADIGSDHGITAIKVYEEKKPMKVIATDISAPSLQKLVDKLSVNNYEIETKVTDGLKGLDDDIQQIIITGMGGHLIVDILNTNFELAKSAEKIVTSPNNSLLFYRKWMHENGFEIIEDDLIKDEGLIYSILVVRYTGLSYRYEDEYQYRYGKENLEEKKELVKELIQNDIDTNNYILSTFEGKDTPKIKNRTKELISENNHLEDLLCKLKS